MMRWNILRSGLLACMVAVVSSSLVAQDKDETAVEQVRALSEKRTEAFNSGKADAVAGFFHAEGEYVDELGTLYEGRDEIAKLLGEYFSRFPGLRLTNEIESVRAVGSLVIEEGKRTTAVENGGVSEVRYIAVYAPVSSGWQIASLRDIDDSSPPTPGEMLTGLDWMIGQWWNEGADARVHINYRWSEDKNFILGDIDVYREGKKAANSHQRIGWDPVLGKPRSWLFDSDGGYGEGQWTQVDGSWWITSTAVLPDGTRGSATIKVTPLSSDRFFIAGSNRLVGEVLEDDYEITVAKRPPAPGK